MTRPLVVNDPQKYERIFRMAAAGNSNRAIAMKLRISRGTVIKVLSGCYAAKYGLNQPIAIPQNQDPDLQPGRDGWGLWPVNPAVERPYRCPGCGGKVYGKCRLCLTREIKRREKSAKA